MIVLTVFRERLYLKSSLKPGKYNNKEWRVLEVFRGANLLKTKIDKVFNCILFCTRIKCCKALQNIFSNLKKKYNSLT